MLFIMLSMEAGGSKDHPPMLALGNYVQWKSRIKRYIDTKPNSELIHYCLQNPPYTYQWAEKTVPLLKVLLVVPDVWRFSVLTAREYGHVLRECQKPKRVKDVGLSPRKDVIVQTEELEAHYMYHGTYSRGLRQSIDNSGTIFDDEPCF
ncbi:hypothetical protein Tco_1067626 [Tanacetum coccineum]|uniref:Uncharacterized protein n=1 Tax=Tanacetum coccineum TaxID=301880 RepID=A0ABQ5HEA9_9ASTR